MFLYDDVIIFHQACIAFADSPGKIHFISKKGKMLQSGCGVYFDRNGQFVGINIVCLECDLAHEVIQKMQYEGESQSWN
jgi:hypothetical protein